MSTPLERALTFAHAIVVATTPDYTSPAHIVATALIEKDAMLASQAAEIEQWKVGNARLAELERQASLNADAWQARRDEAHKRYEECFQSRGEYIFLSKLQATQIATLTAQAQSMREALERVKRVSCGEDQLEDEEASDDTEAMGWIFRFVSAALAQVSPSPLTTQQGLFTVQDEAGEMLDISGDGGFSVFTSRAEAQDALDSEFASRPDVPLYIVRYYAVPIRIVSASPKEEQPK